MSFFDNLKIDEEAIQIHLDEWIAELEQKENEKQEFVSSKRINEVIEKVYQYLLSNNTIWDEDIAYFPEKHPISMTEFNLLFNSICEYGELLGLICAEEDNPFFNFAYCTTYKDMNMYFSSMSGQGTIRCINCMSDDDKDWKLGCVFTFSSMGTLI